MEDGQTFARTRPHVPTKVPVSLNLRLSLGDSDPFIRTDPDLFDSRFTSMTEIYVFVTLTVSQSDGSISQSSSLIGDSTSRHPLVF